MRQFVGKVSAHNLQPNDVIHFGGDLCFVVALEDDEPYLEGTVTLITEGPDGYQYVDYVDPHRLFTIVRSV